jgi:hypothetical protein
MYPWPELTLGLELVRMDRRGRKHERLRQENQRRSLALGGDRCGTGRRRGPGGRDPLDPQGAPLEQMGRRGHAAFQERLDRPVATDACRRLLEQVDEHGR